MTEASLRQRIEDYRTQCRDGLITRRERDRLIAEAKARGKQ